MLPNLRRVSSILRKNQFNSSGEHLSKKSSSSSSRSSEDGNNVYIETLLYIVHVDDIDLPLSNDVTEEMYDGGDEQMSISSNQFVRRGSKRTTASFNEHHQTPIYSRPSFPFSNPLRRLNSLLQNTGRSSPCSSTPKLNDSPLCSSKAKRSSFIQNPFELSNQNQNQNRNNAEQEQQFPPPPPSFLYENPTEGQLKIEASGSGLTDGFVDENCHFDLNAPNAELHKLVIAIDGPSKADIQIEVVNTGIYRVFYTCRSSGNYQISLTYDGSHIHGSPYHLTLRNQQSQEQLVPPALPPSIIPPCATIEPLQFYINRPCLVTVRPTVPCAVFQAYIQTPEKHLNLPITVHKSAKSESYEISFVPTICGNYWLNINLNHISIVDNPCRLIVRSSPFSSKPIAASGQGLFHAYIGESSQFFVSKSGQDRSSSSERFSVGISGPSTVFLDANETEHGYEFHYKPLRCGKYLITIKNGDKHIQGSPFICRVYNKVNDSRTVLSPMYEAESDLINETTIGTTTPATTSCNSLIPFRPLLNPMAMSTNDVDVDIIRSSMSGDASQVCVFGTGLYEAKPRRKATFKIDASQAGPGLLLVGLYSSLGPFERLVVKRMTRSSSAFIYKVSYRVRVRGQYLLVIVYGATMQNVPGSPYLVIVE